MHPPSAAATYERARRLANIAIWTIGLQRRRLRTKEPEDGKFLFRRWADFQFLIVALTRLRRAAVLATHAPEVSTTIKSAISDFDVALPDLKKMRDAAEHIDDYARDKGKKKEISRQSLEVGIVSDRNFEWLGCKLNVDVAKAASEALFKAIQSAGSAFRAKLRE